MRMIVTIECDCGYEEKVTINPYDVVTGNNIISHEIDRKTNNFSTEQKYPDEVTIRCLGYGEELEYGI